MEKSLEQIPANNKLLDSCEISCTDETGLKALTDNGYVGVRLIRVENKNLGKHKIVFEKYSSN